jgi:hypothetical protein
MDVAVGFVAGAFLLSSAGCFCGEVTKRAALKQKIQPAFPFFLLAG